MAACAAVIPLGVTGYELSLFLHITAVMVGFGATFAEAVAFPLAMRMSQRHLPYVHRLQLVINAYFAVPAFVVVLATGVYQVIDADFGWGDFWISGAMTIVIVLAALNLAYFIPADRRLGPMVEREIEAAGDGEVVLSDEYQRQARAEGILGGIAGVLLVVAVYLMVTKPGL